MILPPLSIPPPPERTFADTWLCLLRFQAWPIYPRPVFHIRLIDTGPARIWTHPAAVLPYCAPLPALPALGGTT